MFHWNIRYFEKKFNKYSNVSLNLFQQWTDENPVTVPAIIPWQGSFHVHVNLNAEESTVRMPCMADDMMLNFKGGVYQSTNMEGVDKI